MRNNDSVLHKETLKELKKQADVLILDSNANPRTLHMSMLGIFEICLLLKLLQPSLSSANLCFERMIVHSMMQSCVNGAWRSSLLSLQQRTLIDRRLCELQELISRGFIGLVHIKMSEIVLEDTLYWALL